MLGKTLRRLRQSAGETQKELSNAVYVSESAISQYETGRTTPKHYVLEALAKHYNVTTDYLLGTSPNPALEEAMNQIYCDGITVSTLLDKCLNISAENRSHILAIINAFQPTDSKVKSKGPAK